MAQAGGRGEATQNMSQYTYKARLDSQDGLSTGYHVSLQVNLENKKMVAVPTKSIVEKDAGSYTPLIQHNLELIVRVTGGDSEEKTPNI